MKNQNRLIFCKTTICFYLTQRFCSKEKELVQFTLLVEKFMSKMVVVFIVKFWMIVFGRRKKMEVWFPAKKKNKQKECFVAMIKRNGFAKMKIL